MLAHDSFGFGVSGTSEAESMSAADRTRLTQLEAELQRSEVYRHALENLDSAEATSTQFCLKTVAREAIRLAMREGRSTPAPDPIRPLKAAIATDREDGLRRLGAHIQAARKARSMSIAELHSKTLVPVHQLHAIEVGHGTHLPEDVYLRGFIKRIAAALQIESEELLDMLPAVDPVKAVLPTWYHPQQKHTIGVALKPAHLYVGYAALLAGGVAWLSHQATAPASSAIDPAQQVSPKSQAQSGAKVSAEMQVSAPERF